MRWGGSGIRWPWQWPQIIAERSESSLAGLVTNRAGAICSFQLPARPRDGRKSALRMLARRSVTSATGDAQFGHLRLPRSVVPIEAGLGLHVVAEDAVHIPFRDVLGVSGSIGIKERPIQVHPAALDQIVRDGQARPGIAGLRQVLLDSPGTDRAHDFVLLCFSVYARELHPVGALLAHHLGANALISDGVLAFEITQDAFGTCFLRHRAVKGGVPARVVRLVAFSAIPRFEITRIRPSRPHRRVARRHRPNGDRHYAESEQRYGPGEKRFRESRQNHREFGERLGKPRIGIHALLITLMLACPPKSRDCGTKEGARSPVQGAAV